MNYILFGIIILTISIGFTTNSSSSGQLKVAIVHSYSSDFYWTKEVEKGFLSVLGEKFKIELVYKSYLDAKKEPFSIEQKTIKTIGDLGKINFDLLFVTDDDALDRVGKKYFSTNKSVVFAGINAPLTEYGNNEEEIVKKLPSNVSGVLEKYDMYPLITLVKDLLPKKKNLILLFDKSKTSDGVYQNLISEISNKKMILGLTIKSITRSNNLNTWVHKIKEAKKDDVLIIFPFSNIKRNDKKLQTSDEFASWLASISHVPEFATASLYKSNNFFSTVGINPFEHGEDAAYAFLNTYLYELSGQRVKSKNYARLKLNSERAQSLKINIPFELMAYSHALTRIESNEK